MIEVTDPNGGIHKFPAGTSPEVIKTAMAKTLEGANFGTEPPVVTPEPETPLSDKLAETFAQGRADIAEDLEKAKTSRYGPIAPMAGTAVNTAAGVVGDVASAALPDFVKDLMGDAWASIEDQPLVQQGLWLAMENQKLYERWAEENPDQAYVASRYLPLLTAIPAGPKTDFSRTARKWERNEAGILRRRKKIGELIEPADHSKGDGKAKESKKGFWRGGWYELTDREEAIAMTLETVDEINPGRSFRYNQMIAFEEADKLRAELDKLAGKHHKTRWDKGSLNESLDEVMEEVANVEGVSMLPGELSNQVENIVAAARNILLDVPSTPRGLLEARRRFDEAARKAGAQLGTEGMSLRDLVVTSVRTRMNEMFNTLIPDDAAYDLLQRQHNLLSGGERMLAKMSGEKMNTFSRTAEILREYGLVGGTLLSSLALSSYALGSASFLVPVAGAAGLGAAGYGLKKGSDRILNKRNVGRTISQIDRVLKKGGLSVDDVAQLRAARLYLIDIIREEDDTENYVERRETTQTSN